MSLIVHVIHVFVVLGVCLGGLSFAVQCDGTCCQASGGQSVVRRVVVSHRLSPLVYEVRVLVIQSHVVTHHSTRAREGLVQFEVVRETADVVVYAVVTVQPVSETVGGQETDGDCGCLHRVHKNTTNTCILNIDHV